MKQKSWFFLIAALTAASLAAPTKANPPLGLSMQSETTEGDLGRVARGIFRVHEDRARGKGRILDLKVLILRAKRPASLPDPVFFIIGGPGIAASEFPQFVSSNPARETRDIVLVDQRGTGSNNRLACTLIPPDAEPQRHLEYPFAAASLKACLARLRRKADLRFYSTPLAMDDLDDVRAALGYRKINLYGASYGTRAALVYMRQHPDHVRSAVLDGVVPLAFTIPLYHPQSAQRAIDQIFALCATNNACSAAFPNVVQELARVTERLRRGPISFTYENPENHARSTLRMSAAAFAEALRYVLYDYPGDLKAPLLIHRAYLGDFSGLVDTQIAVDRRFAGSIAWGMNFTVTCSEDVARIDPATVSARIEGSFIGDHRVRNQIEACKAWPRSTLPSGYGRPVSSDAPTLLISGLLDPVTPPRWGEEAASHLLNSRHVMVLGGHTQLSSACAQRMIASFIDNADPAAFSWSCPGIAVEFPVH